MTPDFLANLEETLMNCLKNHVKAGRGIKDRKVLAICDIIKSKTPREIYLSNQNTNEQEILLRDKSDIVSVIKAKNILKVYVKPTIIKNIDCKRMKDNEENS